MKPRKPKRPKPEPAEPLAAQAPADPTPRPSLPPVNTSTDAGHLPACPEHLQDEARLEWTRVLGELAAAGQIHRLDRAILANYCEAWQRWVDAQIQLKRTGPIVKSPSGFPIQNPYLAVANKAMEQIARLAGDLGLSPSSRARMTGSATPAESDAPADTALAKRPAPSAAADLAEPKARAAARAQMIASVLDWILEGQDEQQLLAAIATHYPAASAPAVLTAAMRYLQQSGAADPQVVKGFAMEATRAIYQQALAAKDLATALRAVRQLTEIAGR